MKHSLQNNAKDTEWKCYKLQRDDEISSNVILHISENVAVLRRVVENTIDKEDYIAVHMCLHEIHV